MHTIAADPFRLVSNRVSKSKAEYDEDKNWDGIFAFAGLIGSLPSRKGELRPHSKVRFLGEELGVIASSPSGAARRNKNKSKNQKHYETTYPRVGQFLSVAWVNNIPLTPHRDSQERHLH
jgi:hypothetical protein